MAEVEDISGACKAWQLLNLTVSTTQVRFVGVVTSCKRFAVFVTSAV